MSLKALPDFASLDQWGDVFPGTIVVDSNGERYVVEPQNDRGFLNLRNQSGGKHQQFETLDRVDHAKYRESGNNDRPDRLSVTLTAEEYGIPKQVGSIRFEGLKIAQVDGSVRIPTVNGEVAQFSYRCIPNGCLPVELLEAMAPKIAVQLSQRVVIGEIDGYKWNVDE